MVIKYTFEILEPIVKSSITWAEVCRKLNIAPMTGAQTHIKKRVLSFNIDTSHFVGQSFNRDRKFGTRDALEYCFKGSMINSHRLRINLIRDGYKKDECEICKCSEWQGYKLPLELDHIDSDHFNNEFDNLQILCPNCHAVETAKRRRPKVRKTKEPKPKPVNHGRRNYERVKSRKVERPSLESLLADSAQMSKAKIGAKYGVSGNAVRKWITQYQKYDLVDSNT